MSSPVSTAAGVELVATGNGQSPSEPAQPLPVPAAQAAARRSSGRIRHEDKITVYISAEELLALEQARLTLRARHARVVDRGRIVREAIAAALADLEVNGDDSELVRRLSAL